MSYLSFKKRYLLLYSQVNTNFNYVSLGDSIAAGHAIDDAWETNYGRGSQYGSNGNTETAIVPNTYTALIGEELRSRYKNVSVKSFAKSGDTVADLIEKLDHAVVRRAIERANLVTICIGANDILGPALDSLEQYINTGDLSELEDIVDANLTVLDTDGHSASYVALLNKLNQINPGAKYVFMTIYNPYKYLYLEESTEENDYKDGFLGPVMWSLLDAFGNKIANPVRAEILGTDTVRHLFERVNCIGAWAEPRINRLNQILRDKISKYANAFVAEAKLLFESVPDRPISAQKHYNDLVNVEFTRGFNTDQMDWGRFWANATIDWSKDTDGVAEDIVNAVIDHVIVPDIDPHPKTYGHDLLKCIFGELLGWGDVPKRTVTFYSNGGSGVMDSQVIMAPGGLPPFVCLKENGFIPSEGHYFVGWNTAPDGKGTPYMNGQLVGLAGDLALYAQWTNITHTVTYRHSENSNFHGSDDTGPMENYAFYINGVQESDLGEFSKPARELTLPHGTMLKVWVKAKFSNARSYVTFNGVTVAEKGVTAEYEFPLTTDTDIHFEWDTAGNEILGEIVLTESYWKCHITTY